MALLDLDDKLPSVWADGECNKCGSVVFEMGCDGHSSEEEKTNDYKNFCSNKDCEEHKWHYVGDQDFLEYYNHN